MIVSDINMPDGDGYQLLRSIRLRPEVGAAPAIALTGNPDETRALLAGYSLQLHNPVNPATLYAAIKRALHDRAE